MKKIFLFAAALCVALTINAKQVQIVDTIFTDDFATLRDCYTLTSPVADKIKINENQMLALICPKDSSSAQHIAVADYGRDTALNEMPVDSLVWTFNMRQNYNPNNTSGLSGFDSGKRGIATMLVANGTDLKTANGYAVAFGGNSKIQYRLVKVTGGLYGNSHLADVIGGQIGTDKGANRYFYTFRIVYIPATHTWKMQEVNNNSTSGSFIAPTAVEAWSEDGTTEDDTFGNTHLKYFGFYHNYAGTIDFNMYIDNFTLAAYRMVDEPETPTALDDVQNQNRCTKVIENGQLVIIRNGVKYSITGAAL